MPVSKTDPSKPSTMLAQLDLIEATADRGETARKPEAPQAAPSGMVYEMLIELRRDIQALKNEQSTLAVTTHEQQLHGLLTELHRDIEALKGEQEAWTAKQKQRQLQELLLELRQDITTLHGADAPPVSRSRSALRAPPAQPQPAGMGHALKVAIPVGIVGGVAAAFALLLASGQLTPGPGSAGRSWDGERVSPPVAAMATPEQLVETARVLLAKGDIAFARRVLGNAVTQGSTVAAVMLAKTYDPRHLAQLYNPAGVAPDEARARMIYESAVRAGSDEAAARLREMSGGKN